MSGKPRAILITRNLPPLQGGMERLNRQIAIALDTKYDLIVVGPKGCREYLPDTVSTYEIPLRPAWLFVIWGCLLSAYLSRRYACTIAIGGSGLVGPALLMMSRRATSFVYVHGLDLVTRHPLYRWIWIPSLRRLDYAIANSRATADVAARLSVAGRRISVVNPGTDIPVLHKNHVTRFRSRHRLENALILLSVGRSTRRKGICEFIVNCLPTLCHRFPAVMLVLIGDDAPDSLHSDTRTSHNHFLAASRSANVESHIKTIGRCSDEELHEAYAAADVHIFPVLNIPGDMEGFGMVAIEAAAHRLPTVAFAVGGVPDAVEEGVSGYLVPPGDYEAFCNAVSGLLTAGSHSPIKKTSRRFATNFSWAHFNAKLLSLLDSPNLHLNPQYSSNTHAVLDLSSRTLKARKIEKLLALDRNQRGLSILEIGTGSGGIASYFATHPRLRCSVDAVDVVDNRQLRDGYRFTLIHDTQLPFAANQFDLVISNHVIEHVGTHSHQLTHLQEIRRVLRSDGLAYLAVPNRWQLVEPHYRLAFLSWLPRPWRTPYLRIRNRGQHYDCNPLSVPEIERMFDSVHLRYRHEHRSALLTTYELEKPHSLIYHYIWKHTPAFFYQYVRHLFPTLIYIIQK